MGPTIKPTRIKGYGTWIQSVRVGYVVGEVQCYCLLVECCCGKGASALRASLQGACRGPCVEFTVDFISIPQTHAPHHTQMVPAPLTTSTQTSPPSSSLLSSPMPPSNTREACEGTSEHTEHLRKEEKKEEAHWGPNGVPSSFPMLTEDSSPQEELCPICQVEPLYAKAVVTTLCQHRFHLACYAKLAENSAHPGCPICRLSLYDSLRNVHCEACGTTFDLWTCLLCGYVGCGRTLSTSLPAPAVRRERSSASSSAREKGSEETREGRHASTSPGSSNTHHATTTPHYIQHFLETGHTCALQCGSHRIWNHVSRTFFHQEVAMELFKAEEQVRKLRQRVLRQRKAALVPLPPPLLSASVPASPEGTRAVEEEDLVVALALEEEGRVSPYYGVEDEDSYDNEEEAGGWSRLEAEDLDWNAFPSGETALQRACRLQAEEEEAVLAQHLHNQRQQLPPSPSPAEEEGTEPSRITSELPTPENLLSQHYYQLFRRLRKEQWMWYNSIRGRTTEVARLRRQWNALQPEPSPLMPSTFRFYPKKDSHRMPCAKRRSASKDSKASTETTHTTFTTSSTGEKTLLPTSRRGRSARRKPPARRKNMKQEERTDKGPSAQRGQGARKSFQNEGMPSRPPTKYPPREVEEDDDEEEETFHCVAEGNAPEVWVEDFSIAIEKGLHRFYESVREQCLLLFSLEWKKRMKLQWLWRRELQRVVFSWVEEATTTFRALQKATGDGKGEGKKKSVVRTTRSTPQMLVERYWTGGSSYYSKERRELEERRHLMQQQVANAKYELDKITKRIRTFPQQHTETVEKKKREIAALQQEIIDALNRA